MHKKLLTFCLAFITGLILSGCGQNGPLYLPSPTQAQHHHPKIHPQPGDH